MPFRMSLRTMACLLLVGGLVTGCLPAKPGEVRIHIDNQTDASIAIYVNEAWVGTYPAGAKATAPIAGHGGPPYRVAAEDPSGIELTSTIVPVDEVESIAAGTTMVESMGTVGCGYVRISVATQAGFDDTQVEMPEGCP